MKTHADMNVVYFSNEFPTGDLQAIFRQLYNNSQDNSHNVLAQLISRATAAMKNEIQSLPTGLLQLFSSFESLFEWADDSNLRTGPLCGAVDGVLLVLVQLALYINHTGDDFARHRNMKQAHLAALGVGLLSGAAVSMAPVVADIPLHGADAIVLAFRMGIHVQSISSQLESQDASERPETWAYVVHNIDPGTVQAELDALHGSTSSPNTNKIFISAISETSVTISGPPSRLKSLFQRSKLFRDATSIALPVYGGLCHAPHIYGSHDIQAIVHKGVKELHAKLEKSSEPMSILHSTSSGDPYHAANGVELFELVVAELLTKAIEWNKVIASLVSYGKISSLASITLNCFGKSIPLHDLEETLKNSLRDTEISVISLLSSLQDPTSKNSTSRGFKQAKLAIVGMSCRLPGGARDTEKFWEVLENGLDVSREIPPDRFDIDTHFDAEGKDMNKTMTRYGCFIDDPASFDAAFFNMSPREALAVDPQMRLMLVTAYEALERAGFIGNRTLSTRLDRIGTYFGQAADDYREVNQGQEVGTYYIPGGCRAFGPGRINYFFKFAGPSYSVDTACSSGLAAIELACQALWNGNVDMVVTGGVNVLTNPDGFTGLGKGHFLTKGHNACKTWDATADGYCRADGVGSLVIKRLEDAQADNDNILGLILATGTNHSAEAVSITHPHAGHQAYLSRQVVRQAGINALDVTYIELHGTGTQAGDYEEMQGVLDVYAPASAPRRRSDQSLHIGSVKSNLGHGESVAGTTALIKVLLMLQKNAIPRHIGIKTEINPRFPKDFDKRNVHIPFSHTPWVQQTRKRIAAVNNFGAAGGNTMMIVEEAPTRAAPQTCDTRGTHAVVVSAKTKTSLAKNIENLVDYLRNNCETVSLSDLGYTTTARRYQHSYRAAVTASSIDWIIAKLLAQSEKVNAARPVGKTGNTAPSVAFAFTGQGASYSSMALELYHDAPTFRDHIQHFDALVQGQGFPSLISAIDGTHPRDYVHSAIVTQLALVCIEMALAHYWQSLGVTPDVVIGHSLGEYAAMQVAGVISASDAIFMVGKRAEMLQNACEPNTYCMLAVRAPLQSIVETARGKPYTVACINSPGDTVLSGTVSDMGNITLTLEAAGFRCIKLKVPYAFHSEQTDPILDEFEATCRSGVVFHEPKLPIISPLFCKVVFDDQTFNAEYVRRATREAVDFVSALQNAEGVSIDSDTIWIEIGPHPVCTGFVHSTLSSQILALPSFRRDESNWKTLAETMSKLYLAGVGLNWNEFHRPFEKQVRLLDLPTYAWDEKEYWMQYNGDWCLTKGNTYYDKSLNTLGPNSIHEQVSENVTSLVHKIVEKHIDGVGGSIVMRSNLMQKDFLAAANGHRMNDSGVVTSSIHADIAYTLGELLYKEFYPDTPCPDMEITNLVVEQALIAQKGSTSIPQIIQVTARTADIHLGVVNLIWQNVNRDMTISEPFANASIVCGKAVDWFSSWIPIAHLVQHRIEMLDSLAARGEASRLTRSMAYTLFAKNLVDYAGKYRGMQSVVMRGLEGFADVELSTKEDSATWTVPPYFIDSVAHLAGFIMNCSDAIDTQANYCVTSGWSSMRFATPLVAGDQYRSYVRMVPTEQDSSAFLGDVIILRKEDNAIVGMVQGIRFRRFPRILLNRFFTAPVAGTGPQPTAQQRSAASNRPSPARTMPRAVEAHSFKVELGNYDSRNEIPKQLCTDSQMYIEALGHRSKFQSPSSPKPGSSGDEIPTPSSKVGGIADQALALIARETALDITALVDDADFAGLGIDSLMSLVLAEKFRIELDVRVNGSLFLDYPTIGDLRSWLIDYHC